VAAAFTPFVVDSAIVLKKSCPYLNCSFPQTVSFC
jgi:hypothetical protein